MNIDKIIANETQSCYLNKLENPLKILGLTFSDLKTIQELENVNMVSEETLLLRVISEMMPTYQDL